MAVSATRSSHAATGRREHRKHRTRRELLTAGRRLFAEEGLYDARIEDLTRMAGIAKGTLYGYFASKEELIEAVVTSGFSELLGHAHRAVQGARSQDEAVARIAEAHFLFFEENPDLMRVFHQVRGLLKFNRPGAGPLRAVLADYLTNLAQVLAMSPRARGAHDVDDLDLALLLFGAVSGICSVRASVQGRLSSAIGQRALVHALVGLCAAAEPAPRAASSKALAGARRRVVVRAK